MDSKKDFDVAEIQTQLESVEIVRSRKESAPEGVPGDKTINCEDDQNNSIGMTNFEIISEHCFNLPEYSLKPVQPLFLYQELKNSWQAELYMPPVSPILTKYFQDFGPTKEKARESVCLRAVNELNTLAAGEPKDEPVLDSSVFVRSNGQFLPSQLTGCFVPGISVFLNIIEFTIEGKSEISTIGFSSYLEIEMEPFEIPLNEIMHKVRVYSLSTPTVFNEVEVQQLRKYTTQFFKIALRSKLKEITEWAAHIIPLTNKISINKDSLPSQCIDWAALRFASSTCNLTPNQYLQKYGIEELSKLILFDKIRYQRYYIIKEITEMTPESMLEEEDGFQNLADFYKLRLNCREKIDKEQKLIRADFLGYTYQCNNKRKEHDELLLIPQFSKISAIFKCHALESRRIPALTQVICHRLLVAEFHHGLENILPCNTELLMQALTAPSSLLPFNYERMEILGDSFIKLTLTTHLFVTEPLAREGFLNITRQNLECNENMFHIGCSLKIHGLILTNNFNRRKFLPWSVAAANRETLKRKVVADGIESIVAACYLHAGPSGGNESIRYFFGTNLPSNFADYDIIGQIPPISFNTDSLAQLEQIEKTINYKFKNLSLLVLALTHSSYKSGKEGSYERLEHLGDTVLGFVVTKVLYDMPENYDQGTLSGFRSELVNNCFLAVISNSLNLLSSIRHEIPDFETRINDWKLEIQSIFDNGEIKSFFWYDLKKNSKLFGDVFESLLGSVYADSNFDQSVVEKLVKEILFNPWWQTISSMLDEENKLEGGNPKRIVYESLSELSCNALEIKFEQDEQVVCILMVHNLTLGRGAGRSKKEAKHEAFVIAAKGLSSQHQSIKMACTCN